MSAVTASGPEFVGSRDRDRNPTFGTIPSLLWGAISPIARRVRYVVRVRTPTAVAAPYQTSSDHRRDDGYSNGTYTP